MNYRLLSLRETAPEGFTYCPVLEQRDVRRWPFALLAPDLETAESALASFGPTPVGIIVTYGNSYLWQQISTFRYHLALPPLFRDQPAALIRSHLDLLGNWHQTEMRNSGLLLNLSRASEDNNRQQAEFAVIRENLLNELALRKRIENELLTTRNHLAATLDALPDLLFEVGADSRIYDYHSPRTELLAASPRSFLNRKMSDVLVPEVASVCLAAIQEAQEKGSSFGKQYELQLPHGWFWFELSVSAKALSEKGEPRFIMLARDITKRKSAELELQRKNTDMEQFIYTVSHDLRSPLVTIKTFLGYLETDMDTGDRMRIEQDLHYIHGAADRMRLLLDELLELSRIDRVESLPATMTFQDVAGSVLDILAGMIDEHQVEILLPETELVLFGDRARFCQILQNLIENAIKYRRSDTAPHIEVGIRQTDGEVTFFVKDNGLGIDPKYHDKVFGLFEKLDPHSSGVGIGLAMVKRIIEKGEGRIWVESEGKNAGSSFFFTLPRAVRGRGGESQGQSSGNTDQPCQFAPDAGL